MHYEFNDFILRVYKRSNKHPWLIWTVCCLVTYVRVRGDCWRKKLHIYTYVCLHICVHCLCHCVWHLTNPVPTAVSRQGTQNYCSPVWSVWQASHLATLLCSLLLRARWKINDPYIHTYIHTSVKSPVLPDIYGDWSWRISATLVACVAETPR